MKQIFILYDSIGDIMERDYILGKPSPMCYNNSIMKEAMKNKGNNGEEFNLAEIMERFGNEDAARKLIEKISWPTGPVCPHCGYNESYRLKPKESSKKPGRKGLLKCKDCRKQFTVTVGTIFEGSHIPLNKWLMSIYLICSSKKGISAHQLHRMLEITYKSAWFMAHRIRFAMSQPPLSGKLQGILEADETYVDGRAKGKRGRCAGKKSFFNSA